MDEKACPVCTERKKHRSEEEYKSLSNRLSRISGQVKGLQKMLDESAYCPDILIQVSAVTSALNAFSRELLNSHIRTCVTQDIMSGKEDAAEELIEILRKMQK
ncbi:MAG: metal-sensing transcriptional repressor [Clostridia bacterium]|nr:metal-sensing transcriptional repressor [Clostridia bacterium]